MKKLIVNLALVVITGLAFIWSYYNLIDNIQKNHSKEAQIYLTQNQAIKDLQSKYPNLLSINEVIEYDKKHGTQILLSINKTIPTRALYHETSSHNSFSNNNTQDLNLNYALESLKIENTSKADEITTHQKDFWSFLPPLPALLFGGIGIFFGTLITNLGNTCYTMLPDLLVKYWWVAIIVILLIIIFFIFISP